MQSDPAVALDSEPTLLHSLPDDELLRRLCVLVAQSRRVDADLIAHIGEVDERGLFARQAFPSMFAYCTQALHLSEAEAYRRITVARAARKHPMLLGMLRDGRLHLSGMALLVPLLTPETRDSVLARAIHRSKREIEELVAELQPRPDVPSGMRKLPDIRRRPVPRASQPVDETLPATIVDETQPSTTQLFPGTVGAMTPPRVPSAPIDAPFSAPSFLRHGLQPAPAESPLMRPRPAVVKPLSPARYKVQFTASAELHDKLERLAALMRSQVPDGNLAALVEYAVTEKLERLDARRFAKTAAPRKTLSGTDTSPGSRHIPAAVRRAVRERDQDRCRFVDEQGRRCSERHRLEFHHGHPFGMAGDHSPGNVRLMCAAHNRYLAECDYGQAAVRRRREAKTPREAPAGV
jgi:hypothetical protein